MPENGIYLGNVYHGRHMPFRHDLKYRVFSFFVNIDDMPRLDKALKLFSYNRWNLTSLYDKDHGRRDGSSIRPWIEAAAREKDIDLSDAQIYMLAFPRLWGYVFNPITVYFCYTPLNELIAVLYEVKNTFGEQHGYFLPVEKEEHGNLIRQSCDKVFHVSPFIHMNCTYHFRLKPPDEKLNLAIHQETPEGKILTATWHGDYLPLNDKTIGSIVLKYPFMTYKIIGGIHWEALKLVFKGARYIKKPPLPEKEVS